MATFADNRGRSAGSRGGRGRRGAGRHRRHESDRVQLSKRLTYALRHGAETLGLHLRPDGFVSLDELLSTPNFRGVSKEQVEQVVAEDEKGRMTIATFPTFPTTKSASTSMSTSGEDAGDAAGAAGIADAVPVAIDRVFIRANQGHSIKGVVDEEQLLTKVEDVADIPVCVHGTDRKSWPSIREEGLRCMNRTHIHFAAGLPGESGVISGMRRSCKVFIYVDVAAAMSDGVVFFRSSNNVILTSGKDGTLEPRYFCRVEGVSEPEGASAETKTKFSKTRLGKGKGKGGSAGVARKFEKQARDRSDGVLHDAGTGPGAGCSRDSGGGGGGEKLSVEAEPSWSKQN